MSEESEAGEIPDSQSEEPAYRTVSDETGAGGGLDNPGALFGMAIAHSPAIEEGSQIGPYKLLQQLGEGAFGEVWEAIQRQPVKRYVALKVLKVGMDSKEFLGRFEVEIRALEKMTHPGIARILDAGMTSNGRPYFVMELVRGMPATEYCRSHKIGTTERLALFAEICGAVQHAHQKAVIHRDLKPSNILVAPDENGKPVSKIIDFGLAKALDQPLSDRTLRTRIDQFLGTPAYMSPEQAGHGPLDVDTRSDVYSLGVLLYELVSGVTPFDARTLSEGGLQKLQRMIREKDPPRLSSRISELDEKDRASLEEGQGVDAGRLRRAVRRDLDWVVMKALEKDPARRYESASALGRDIQRYLDQEPVEAVAPSPVYRLGKFVRRNRDRLVAASLLLLTAIGMTGAMIWGAGRDEVSKKALVEKDIAIKEKDTAIEEKDTALAIASKEKGDRRRVERSMWETQQLFKFLRTMLTKLPENYQGQSVTVVEVVDWAVIDAQGYEDAPRIQLRLYSELSGIYSALGMFEDAEELRVRIEPIQFELEEKKPGKALASGIPLDDARIPGGPAAKNPKLSDP